MLLWLCPEGIPSVQGYFLSHGFYLIAKLSLLLCLWPGGALAGGPGTCLRGRGLAASPFPLCGFPALHQWKGCPVIKLRGLCPDHVGEMISQLVNVKCYLNKLLLMHIEIQSVFSCSQILETTRVQGRKAENTNREHFLGNASLLPRWPVLVASGFLSHGEVIF